MEKLIYLIWAPPSARSDLPKRLRNDIAGRLLGRGPLGLQMNLDDDEAATPGPVPTPENELPLVAQVSLWLNALDERAPYEEILRDVGVRRAGYLVTESLYTDYGQNEHHPQPRGWPDGERSPGLLTVTLLEMPARFDYDNWLGHWYGHQSPMSGQVQPRMRYVRNTVTHALTPGAPPYRGIVEEGWPSPEHIANPMLFYNAEDSPEKMKENLRIMLDSVTHMFDMDRIRGFTMSEYLLKTVGA